ncbi:MAG: hypothetical protein AAF604_14240 [Acidobacteriota bacterium]
MSAAALARGWSVTRANPALVAWTLLTMGAVLILTVAGAVAPLLTALGWDFQSDLAPLAASRSVEAVADAVIVLEDAFDRSAVVTGTSLALVLWTAALVLYCFAQAGLWGSLGELRRRGLESRLEAARLVHWGKRLFAPFFWFVNLYAVVASALLLLAVVALALGVRGALAAQLLAACGIFAVAIALLVVHLWYGPGRAALAWPSNGLGSSLRRGLGLLRQRFAAVLLLAALVALAGLLSSAVASLLSATLGRLAFAVQLVLGLLQGVVTAFLATLHAAALVNLLRPAMETAP